MSNPHLRHALKYRGGRMLLSFQHGLGDLINFLPLFMYLPKHYSNWKFSLALNFKMGMQAIVPIKGLYDINERTLWPRFDFMYRVQYPEPSVIDTVSKPLICAREEFGIDPANVAWSPVQLHPRKAFSRDPRRVGIHFFGHTSPHNKSCTTDLASVLWDELFEAGFHPFEIQMQKPGQDVERLPFITPANSLRYQPANLQVMVDFLHSCQWFVGIDSGPLYTAIASIGSDRCVAMELKNRVQNYAPCDITSVSIEGYQRGSLVKTLQGKEGKP